VGGSGHVEINVVRVQDQPEAPEIATVLPWLEAGMKFGRDMELGRVQGEV
jgi:hypothetical protein